MSSVYGTNLKISIFGQSHSDAIGVVIDGFPAGFKVDFEQLHKFLSRRSPGKNKFSSKRKESDTPQFISGFVDGVTCGAPICAVIKNNDARPEDYSEISNRPRPSHADYPADAHFCGFEDLRGGGHYSGRLTAALCVAGGICMQYLNSKGISIGAHISSIGGVNDIPFDKTNVTEKDFIYDDFPVIDPTAKENMLKIINVAASDGDSVGGTIECAATGLSAGVGDPIFNGLENKISSAVFGIPAVKGIEFGGGFASSLLTGSQNNDSYYFSDGKVLTHTNNNGGISGGMSNGMPVIFKVAVKPTPSIGKIQDTVDLKSKENIKMLIKGRHDACIVPRAVPCVEAACALAICDLII